jgi:hypothetical protein
MNGEPGSLRTPRVDFPATCERLVAIFDIGSSGSTRPGAFGQD